MIYRHATEADAAQVRALLMTIYQEGRAFVNDDAEPLASLRARLRGVDSDRSLYLIAEDGDGTVVGWLELHRFPAWRLTHVAVLTIAVAQESRRKGIARRLLARAYDWARSVGVLKVSLNVRASNEAAVALYRSEGFALEGREVGQVRRALGGGFEDNLIMGLWLADRPGSAG